jgi:Haem-NO-binding
MYGIVNLAIEELITHNYGGETWESVKKRSGVDVDFFLSNEPYDDSVTYKLAIAASEELKVPLDDVLISFGEFWILNTGRKRYGTLLESGGNHIKEFLVNLPNFHNRIILIYPHLSPPEFKVTNVEENSLHLHYYSHRVGLKAFLRGIIQGLGKLFKQSIQIELPETRETENNHETFKITW